MPCKCDYIIENGAEHECRSCGQVEKTKTVDEHVEDVCEHILYVYKKLGKEAPKRVRRARSDGTRISLAEATDELCSLLKNLSGNEKEEIIYDAHSRAGRNLANWWEDHLKADRVRLIEEEKMRQRQAVIDRLTEEERDLLGLL